MKSEIIDNEVEEVEHVWKYPCLGVYGSGLVVMFTQPRSGVVVTAGNWYLLGTTGAQWDMSMFTPLPKDKGVLLTN